MERVETEDRTSFANALSANRTRAWVLDPNLCEAIPDAEEI